MANTTNFGWETPDDTDLVKDGAAAMRTLGNSIDASFVDLKGGTTGQVLAKASNTDLDFIWSADASGIPETIFDAKGDLIAASAADTATRLAVGTNGTVLTADSTTATGLKWATPSSGLNWSLLNTGGTALTGASTITISGIDKENLFIAVTGASTGTAYDDIFIRFNTDSNSNYSRFGWRYVWDTTYNAGNIVPFGALNYTSAILGSKAGAATSSVSGCMQVTGCKSTSIKNYFVSGSGASGTNNSQQTYVYGGNYNASAAITSVSIVGGSNFDAGTIYVYGA